MVLYNELLPEFRQWNAALLGISVDGVWCHLAFARDRKLQFPLLADFEPKGMVAATYGVYRKPEGVAERALFVLEGGYGLEALAGGAASVTRLLLGEKHAPLPPASGGRMETLVPAYCRELREYWPILSS